MAVELTYVLITPYTILKSRTGGVMSRLLSRTDLELVGAQIFSPTTELTKEYADSVYETIGKRDKKSATMLRDYIIASFSPLNNVRRRVMMLLFKGENACKKVYSIVGGINPDAKTRDSKITGETVRDTYADLLLDENGDVRYFEPAVLTPPDYEYSLERLEMFAKFAGSQPNLVEHLQYDDNQDIERTLTIIKPDNWRYPSSKPGNIIDIFSRAGLRIIGCKIFEMPIKDALEFYGPVKDVLREKLAPRMGEKAKEILERELKIKLPANSANELTGIVGVQYADDQFNQIVGFMSGKRPDECPPEDYSKPGIAKCMILVYEGKNAVKKIRDVLGPTDPTKAPSGTVRKEFGQDIMVNTAHASDSVESAQREMGIVKMNCNTVSSIIFDYLKGRGK